MKGFKIIDKSSKWKKLKSTFEKLFSPYVTVGVHSTAEPYPSGMSVAEVAITHEFGTEKIPERNFFRSTLKAKKTKINKLILKESKALFDTKSKIKKSLSRIGFFVSNNIKNTIKTSGANARKSWRPLKFIKENWPRKKWPKHTSKPLIDSRRLMTSISYELHI